MKIGLIGNMNNCNFAIMRYFRDLGVDAHLLLYSNDGKGRSDHFRPECDTWNIDKWKPFIHQTKIPNSPVAALEFPWSWFVSLSSAIRFSMGRCDAYNHVASKRLVVKTLSGYDKLIGSGIAPSALHRAGYSLDIFYPYSCAIEYLDAPPFIEHLEKKNYLVRHVINLVRERQEKGVLAARKVLNAELGLTESALVRRNIKTINLALPAIYNGEVMPENPPNILLNNLLSVLLNSKFTILSHSRLMWVKPSGYTDDEWRLQSKNNHWVLIAFAELIKSRRELNPILVLFEYGKDVEHTKALCKELNIENSVHWLPTMHRRDIMWLLQRVDVCATEFYDVPRILWGGTGWEALAAGVPLLQGFQFDEGEFKKIYGYPPPPLLKVRSQTDVILNLVKIADSQNYKHTIASNSREWFNKYNGIELAKKWLAVLKD
jgi:hypothetical protein